MAHDRRGKWRVIRELGAGGQGSVFLVFDESQLKLSAWDSAELHSLIQATQTYRDGRKKERQDAEREFIHIKDVSGVGDAIASLLDLASQVQLGALKQLKPLGQWTRDPTHVKDRLLREIAVLRELQHPHLPKLLDANDSAPWLVTDYYPRGTIRQNRQLYANRPIDALRAVRDLVPKPAFPGG